MLSPNIIKDLSVKWQTTPLNVAREYIQHFFLSRLYQFPESDRLAFKGGTALRLVFRSPRFSDDLDFTSNLKPHHLEKLLYQTVDKIRQEVVDFETIEAKPTSGGYLALYRCRAYAESIGIELNISLRGTARSESVMVTSPLVPSYQCMTLKLHDLVAEKIKALLHRKKPRDFFDLYFMLRERLAVQAIIPMKSRLLEAVKHLDAKEIQRELKVFLPVSHQKIASGLPRVLVSELDRL